MRKSLVTTIRISSGPVSARMLRGPDVARRASVPDREHWRQGARAIAGLLGSRGKLPVSHHVHAHSPLLRTSRKA